MVLLVVGSTTCARFRTFLWMVICLMGITVRCDIAGVTSIIRAFRGHSCQSVAILAGAAESVFAILLACRIHEGVIFSNRDTRSLLDKMIFLLAELCITLPLFIIIVA